MQLTKSDWWCTLNELHGMVSEFYATWGLDIPLNPQKFWIHGKRISNTVAFSVYILAFTRTEKKTLSTRDFFHVSNILLTHYPYKYIKMY